MGSKKTCPVGTYLSYAFKEEIEAVGQKEKVGPFLSMCGYVCPQVLGYQENLSDGRCAIRARLLKEKVVI